MSNVSKDGAQGSRFIIDKGRNTVILLSFTGRACVRCRSRLLLAGHSRPRCPGLRRAAMRAVRFSSPHPRSVTRRGVKHHGPQRCRSWSRQPHWTAMKHPRIAKATGLFFRTVPCRVGSERRCTVCMDAKRSVQRLCCCPARCRAACGSASRIALWYHRCSCRCPSLVLMQRRQKCTRQLDIKIGKAQCAGRFFHGDVQLCTEGASHWREREARSA